MKTVCICGSFRHYDEMVAFRDALLASGAACEWPTSDGRRSPSTMTAEEARAAILLYLERMDRADLILIYNKDGHLGDSVVMEIGYARARMNPTVPSILLTFPVVDVRLSGRDGKEGSFEIVERRTAAVGIGGLEHEVETPVPVEQSVGHKPP